MTKPEMTVNYPDGRRFLTFEQLDEARRGQASPEEVEELERLEGEG